jgi:MFS family permease
MELKKGVKKISSKHGLKPLYFNGLIRSIALSLIGIFIPIYLLQKGYSLNFIFFFFLLQNIFFLMIVPLVFYLSKKFSYKSLIITNIPIAVCYLIYLNYFLSGTWSILFLPLLSGIEMAFFWMPNHFMFIKISEDKTRGKKLGYFNIFGQIAGLITPIIGALIMTYLGFNIVSIFSIFFILLSSIPLFYLDKIKSRKSIDFKVVLNYFKSHKKFFIGNSIENILGEANGVIWPIFVYITLKDIISVGFVGILITLGTMIFTYFVGHYVDKKDGHTLLKIGGILFFIVWILRIYYNSPIFLYVISILAGFLAIMIGMSVQKLTYDFAAEKKDSEDFIFFSEISNVFGRSILYIMVIIFSLKFTTAFVLAAIASLFFVFFRFEKDI